MEGSQLLKLQKDGKIEGVIIIKGISNYGYGNNKVWQLTAAMAAVHYVESNVWTTGIGFRR